VGEVTGALSAAKALERAVLTTRLLRIISVLHFIVVPALWVDLRLVGWNCFAKQFHPTSGRRNKYGLCGMDEHPVCLRMFRNGAESV
jgi:hypothetical protein